MSWESCLATPPALSPLISVESHDGDDEKKTRCPAPPESGWVVGKVARSLQSCVIRWPVSERLDLDKLRIDCCNGNSNDYSSGSSRAESKMDKLLHPLPPFEASWKLQPQSSRSPTLDM